MSKYLDSDGLLYFWQKVKTLVTNNKYVHPTYTAKDNGLYKITVDGTGHVNGTTPVVKTDITALGVPAQDTTYGEATTTADGLMSSTDKTRLDTLASQGGAVVISMSGTLLASGWSSSAPYTQTISIASMTNTMTPNVDITLSGTSATDIARLEAWGYIGRLVSGDGVLTATCYESKPSVDLPIELKEVS